MAGTLRKDAGPQWRVVCRGTMSNPETAVVSKPSAINLPGSWKPSRAAPASVRLVKGMSACRRKNGVNCSETSTLPAAISIVAPEANRPAAAGGAEIFRN